MTVPPSSTAVLLDEPPVTARGGWRLTLAGLWCTARPRQWLKNVLVFAAAVAAGRVHEAGTLIILAGTFVVWCLVSSGAYFLNDALDKDADRHHPQKRHRPVATGAVSSRLAYGMGATLVAGGTILPFAWGAPRLGGLIVAYAAMTVSYSLWLKDEPVIDVVVVASGFVLRAISGGVVVGVAISNWFLMVALFGSLFLVAGKRHAEFVDLRDDRGAHRLALERYSEAFLLYLRSVASSVAITAYCLWAFEKAEAGSGFFFQLSIVPFLIGVFRYGLLLEAGHGGAPEEIVLQDRTLQAIGVTWVAIFALGVYA